MSTSFQSVENARQNSKWLLVDAEGQTLGRLASQVASIIRGKHKPSYSPHTDCGDFVVVVNASKIKLTGKKMQNKDYYWHTTYIGGLKSMSAEKLLAKNPERLLSLAVKGMLPKGNLGRNLIKKLKVYDGAEHELSAQTPTPYKLRYS